MVVELEEFLQVRGQAFVAQAFAARLPCAQLGSMGDWAGQVHNAEDHDARVTGHYPHGHIMMNADGWIRIELQDFQGWKPFIAIAGMDAGRNLRANIAYAAEDGGHVVAAVNGQWDPTMTLYEMIGPTSDGTLTAAGLNSYISVSAMDGAGWLVSHAFVGWTQIL